MARLYIHGNEEHRVRVRTEKGFLGNERQAVFTGSTAKSEVRKRHQETARFLAEAVLSSRLGKNTADEPRMEEGK